ncbi:MAG: hypothetical protein AAF657_15180 [Acidobacteriota bacterium]
MSTPASINILAGTWVSTSLSGSAAHFYTDIKVASGRATYQSYDAEISKDIPYGIGTVTFQPSADGADLGIATFTPNDSSSGYSLGVHQTSAGLTLNQEASVDQHLVHRLACYWVNREGENWVKSLDENHCRGFPTPPAAHTIHVEARQTLLLRYDLPTDSGRTFKTKNDWINWSSKPSDWVSGVRLTDRAVLVFDQNRNVSTKPINYSFTLVLDNGDIVDPVIVNKATVPP